MRRTSARVVSAAMFVAALLALTACTPAAPDAPRSAPLLEPPAILERGVLKVAVDAHYPPFASLEGTKVVGIDADVANALASQLGLTAELVDVPASQLATALAGKRVDVALGGVPVSAADLSEVTVATSYLSDAPSLFTAEGTASPDALEGKHIAVQADSPSYWLLHKKMGDAALVVVSTLREALMAVTAGKAEAAAGDAVVAGYIAREYPSLRFSGQLADASPLAVMTSNEASGTETPVREAMDRLAATGVLDAIRSKWLGSLPALTAGSLADTSAVDTSGAPVP